MEENTEAEPPTEAPTNLGDRERYRQRPRKRRTDEEAEARKAYSGYVTEAFDLVPELGNGFRWYDYPYRALSWLLQGWRGKLLRGPMGKFAVAGMNFLSPFNEHDRHKAWSLTDPLHNVFVPADEHVTMAGIWVVELFPPTELPALESALKRNRWDGPWWHSIHGGGNGRTLEKARAGSDTLWWRLIEVRSRNSTLPALDGVRADLPAEFISVSMQAVQVGPSLTAVVAEFRMTDEATASLDVEWHRKQEPLLLKRSGHWQALDRQWAKFWDVQSERKRLHYIARDWLAERLPGAFAVNKEPLPLLDLLLFENFDPTVDCTKPKEEAGDIEEAGVDQRNYSNALRALGFREPAFTMRMSDDLPKLILSDLDSRMHQALGDDPTWTLWGSLPAVEEAVDPAFREVYGGNQRGTVAARLVKNMYSTFVMLAVSQYLSVTEKRYAEIRDQASLRHGRFKPKALSELRKDFLGLSLNLANVRRDVTTFWDRVWQWRGDAEFLNHAGPLERAYEKENGLDSREPTSFNSSLQDHQKEWLDRLIEADRDYREILSTVATLGASATSHRMGRFALCVAAASMVAAITAVAVVDLGSNNLWSHFWGLISD